VEKVVRVGKMPGRIQEVLVQTGTSIREVLELAGLDSTGYEIKIDGQVGSLDSTVGEDTNLIVLAQQIKGA
jgi:putative ubiquitin-RnfH superfamily antitoxin RatB of RatAB toxin-antitoxin module